MRESYATRRPIKNPLRQSQTNAAPESTKQPLTFATAAADILRTQGVTMAYRMFGLNPPGGDLDPTSMFSGMLLARMSSNGGACTDHLHGLLMLALQTLDTLASRTRAHHHDVSVATLFCCVTNSFALWSRDLSHGGGLCLAGGRACVVDLICRHHGANRRPFCDREASATTRTHAQGWCCRSRLCGTTH